MTPILPDEIDPVNDEKVIFQQEYHKVCRRTDRLIALVMCIQWPAAIVIAYLTSSRTWNGEAGAIHPHVTAAFYLGGLITILPVLLSYLHPGERSTRHAMAVCQMLMSALLIHITGGRIESHFHVFGSLAFLAFYLDWEVIATATIVTLLDHAIMAVYAPQLFFGTALFTHWRLTEHIVWVVFCDLFLFTSCAQSLRGLRDSARQDAEQKILIHRAYHDVLTGMGNRLLAQQELNLLIKAQGDPGSFALLAIDLDHFKEVNDTFGHKVGDDLLVQVAQRLREITRKNDTLVRMGGDEFVIILENCTEEGPAAIIAARIVESLNRPFQCGANIVSVGASIGICLYPEGARNIEELFHHADLALYKVKERGRNDYFVFDDGMRSDVERELKLEDRVRTAVHEGLFTLHYQPIGNTEGVLVGFEALLRWNDPIMGSVPPNIFIPVAERCGLIVPLGKWVLEQACLHASCWQASEGGGVKISVNVSPVQLGRPEFVQLVIDTLERTGLRPDLLDLELTETMLVEHAGRSGEAMARLHKLGVRLSIDDFGTGYSSLSYLRDLPVHRLKIDRSFVRDIANSEGARALIESMIEMGHTLKLQVLAEGVETMEQFDILRAAGCNEIQGFLLSRAVPEDQAQALIQHRRLLSESDAKRPVTIASSRGSVIVAA